MEVVIILAFVSVSLAGAAIVLFGHSARARHYEFADRLALLPIEDDDASASERSRETTQTPITQRTES